MTEVAFRQWHFSEGALASADTGDRCRDLVERLRQDVSSEANQDLVVATASEVLHGPGRLPNWIGVDTRYLIVLDIPEPAVLRLPSALGLHKPDQRMHVTRDGRAVWRAAVAFTRDAPWEGIVDAYVLGDRLVVVLGDLRMPEFPKGRLPVVSNLPDEDFRAFEIGPSGSYLHWPSVDVHMGPSQLFQAVDPMFLADVEIARYAASKVSSALFALREDAGLRQRDFEGLSERHVRRLENEESPLTVEAARVYANALGLSIDVFLERLSARVTELKDAPNREAATGRRP